MSQKELFKLMEASPPILDAGQYRISVHQELKEPEDKIYPEVSHNLYVSYPHFTLPVEDIYSAYPSPGSSGNYANTLPHLVMSKKTIPWERRLRSGAPWLALLCLQENEIIASKEMSIHDLLDTNKQGEAYYPLTQMPEYSLEKEKDICKAIDISAEVFRSVTPKLDELKYLTHVKVVDQYDKTDELAAHDGLYSVVIAGRFVPSKKEEAVKSWLHLVSLEGFEDLLSEDTLPDHKIIRLVSLHEWHVFSKSSDSPGFREIFETLDSAPLASPIAEAPYDKGYIPKIHMSRSGEQTASLYRGPLLPYNGNHDSGGNRPIKESYTADGQITYDPSLGMFDLSYAAAWQIGRLLTLQNKPISVNIFNWRRNIIAQDHQMRQKKVVKKRLQAMGEDHSLLDFMVHTLCHELAEKQIVAPVSDDRRDRDEQLGP